MLIFNVSMCDPVGDRIRIKLRRKNKIIFLFKIFFYFIAQIIYLNHIGTTPLLCLNRKALCLLSSNIFQREEGCDGTEHERTAYAA
jgi:hypothetical protein